MVTSVRRLAVREACPSTAWCHGGQPAVEISAAYRGLTRPRPVAAKFHTLCGPSIQLHLRQSRPLLILVPALQSALRRRCCRISKNKQPGCAPRARRAPTSRRTPNSELHIAHARKTSNEKLSSKHQLAPTPTPTATSNAEARGRRSRANSEHEATGSQVKQHILNRASLFTSHTFAPPTIETGPPAV